MYYLRPPSRRMVSREVQRIARQDQQNVHYAAGTHGPARPPYINPRGSNTKCETSPHADGPNNSRESCAPIKWRVVEEAQKAFGKALFANRAAIEEGAAIGR